MLALLLLVEAEAAAAAAAGATLLAPRVLGEVPHLPVLPPERAQLGLRRGELGAARAAQPVQGADLLLELVELLHLRLEDLAVLVLELAPLAALHAVPEG